MFHNLFLETALISWKPYMMWNMDFICRLKGVLSVVCLRTAVLGPDGSHVYSRMPRVLCTVWNLHNLRKLCFKFLLLKNTVDMFYFWWSLFLDLTNGRVLILVLLSFCIQPYDKLLHFYTFFICFVLPLKNLEGRQTMRCI